jgi:hypothetical protein
MYMQLMIHLGLNEIPDFHIMKRWTKAARDILGPGVEGPVDTELSLPKSFRHNIMYVSALELVKMGDLAESKYRIVMKHITAAKKELREDDTPIAPLYYSSDDGDSRRSTNKTTQLEGLAESGAMTSDGMLIKEPLVKRGRGRPKATRFKSFLDGGCSKTAKKDKRNAVNRPEGLSQQTSFCKRCRKPGHNSSTCTVLPDGGASPVTGSLQKKPRRQNRCSNCGGAGHNSTTCTASVEAQDD